MAASTTGFIVFACSLCVLAFEIALTRTYSVLFRSPYVFLVVSVAIGGLGLGGMLASFLPVAADRRAHLIRLVRLQLLLAVALAGCTLLLFGTPLAHGLAGRAEMLLVIALPLGPFIVAGLLFALAFREEVAVSGWLYFSDLAGGATACVLACWLFDGLGALNLVLLLALLAAVGGLLLAWCAKLGLRLQGLAGIAVVAAAVLLAVNLATRVIDLPVLRNVTAAQAHVKPLFAQLAAPAARTRIVCTEWTLFARTDVTETQGVVSRSVWTDGDVPSEILPFSGQPEECAALQRFIGYVPYAIAPRPTVLCIGPGGGFDVALALAGGNRRVDGVEINPSIPRLARHFRAVGGDIYERPGVRLVIEDGRSFVRRSADRYDLIYMALAKTATTATLGLALGDNYLYTVEAFVDYLSHLAPGGMVALLLQDRIQIDRTSIIALAALQRLGEPDSAAAARHLVLARVPEARFAEAGPYRHLLLLGRDPLTPDTVTAISQELKSRGLEPLFLPGLLAPEPYAAALQPGTGAAETAAAYAAFYPRYQGHTVNLDPVTDDCPFYADFSRWLHPQLQQLLVLVTLALAVFAVWGYRRLLGTAAGREDGLAVPLARAGLLYFIGLGVGFMVVEVVMIQKLVLFLGYPSRTLPVTVFALLLFGSLGSLLSQRWPEVALPRTVRTTSLCLAVLLGLYSVAVSPLLNLLLPLSMDARAAVTVLLLAPLGLLMGLPFPAAVRWLGTRLPAAVPVMWGVNGVASVFGSVLAMSLAKLCGYGFTLACGGAIYLAVAALAAAADRVKEDSPAHSSGAGPEERPTPPEVSPILVQRKHGDIHE